MASAEPLEPDGKLLVEGVTCWRRARAHRLAFLVDGEAYFGALAESLERARRSVVLVGWDFHSGMRLRRGDARADSPLGALLAELAERRPGLHIHVLEWDFAMIYALERQSLPSLRFGSRHRRIHFELDGEHPTGASHHQKLAVIDGAVAFTGGFDLAACRWDDRRHAPHDPRRSDPGFPDYPPFHDVGVAVDGDAARALAELAAERWHRATGSRLRMRRRREGEPDPWPEGVAPALRDVEVGLARTLPGDGDQEPRREVEALYREAIGAARRWIYLENQYLTSHSVASALVERLGEPDGPEVVVVGPRRCSGWLEEGVMGVLRARVVRRLREADRHDRLRVLHPVVDGGEQDLVVHGKVMVVDDRLARVGSANLSNRSMGLDSELDLAVEDTGDPAVARAVAALRDDLLAEHLGTTPERVAETLARSGSLVRTVDALGGGPQRTLVPLDADAEVPDWVEEWVPGREVVDPERPMEFEELARRLLPEEPTPDRRRRWLVVGGALLAVALLGALWRWTPLSEQVTPEGLAALAEPLRRSPFGPLAVVGLYALAGLLMVPVTAMIVATALLFGPLTGFTTALAGSLTSAALGYGLGRALWRDTVRRLMGRRVRRLSRRIANRGVMAVAAVRVVPVAPFSAVNLAAGASHVGFRDYLLGTLLGMGPGILALTVLSHRLARAVVDPGWQSFLTLLAVAAAAWLGMRWLRRRLEASDG